MQKIVLYYSKDMHVTVQQKIEQMLKEGWHIDSMTDHQGVLYVVYSKRRNDI